MPDRNRRLTAAPGVSHTPRKPIGFPILNNESCLRLVRALCVETHETWLEDSRYLNMSLLIEHRKEVLRLAA